MKILKTMDNILYFIENADITIIIGVCERIKDCKKEITPNEIKYNVNTKNAVLIFDYQDPDLTEEEAQKTIEEVIVEEKNKHWTHTITIKK